jgi:hypothetical protein
LIGQFDRVPGGRTGPVGKGARQSHHHFDRLQLVDQLREPAQMFA